MATHRPSIIRIPDIKFDNSNHDHDFKNTFITSAYFVICARYPLQNRFNRNTYKSLRTICYLSLKSNLSTDFILPSPKTNQNKYQNTQQQKNKIISNIAINTGGHSR